MINPIIVANPAGEYVMSNWVAYSSAINNCRYFDKLFDGKSIVMDINTINYIKYDKYNSLPILFDTDYNIDVFGVVNIHNLDVLYDYSKKYNETTFILSLLPTFQDYINIYNNIYLLISEPLSGMYGDDETEYIDFSKYMRRTDPVYQDETSTVYRFINIQKIFALYSKLLKRPLYPNERDMIEKIYISDDRTVQVPYYFPLVKI